MKHTRITLALFVTALGLSACGSSSSSSATTTTTPSVCAAKTDLQQSVKALVDPSTLADGKSGITQAADDVEKNLDALGAAVKADLQPDVDAVKSSLDDLKTSIGKLGDGAVGSGLSAVGEDITKASTATKNLIDAVTTRCSSG